MTDPKTFYRELDALLATIRLEPSEGDLIPHVVDILEKTFAIPLNIQKGRIYEQRGQDFILTYPAGPHAEWKKSFSAESETIRLAALHRSYIYDQPELNQSFFNKPQQPAQQAAIWVHNQEEHWMIVFQLAAGWVREEVSLFLNAVRTSLNYRLFTDVIGGHLEQAVKIQKSLLPKQSPKIRGYDIYGHSEPAELVGGDFYDYHDYEDGSFSFSIGDASGHGIPAALLVRDVVIGLRMGLAKELRLIHTLQKLNSVIQRSTFSTNFVSLFIGEIESDGHLFYANAGHPAPILVTPKGHHELEATGITLGFLPEINISRSHIHIPRDSVLVMVTDGIIERQAENEEQYDARLQKSVMENRQKSAKKICDLIFEDAFIFGNRTKWKDDATVVVIKRLND
ncbi:PP2C family protein-serine/threonine phosphatase [candidate division KSB1 bacterium]|nr:PP2C family protein-serine/threonine phosphatase [candidate division KSB1 bacterium]RQW06318.1 MAG: hypothetical protein EH222_08920 [candidate division KSB1 bacterium]